MKICNKCKQEKSVDCFSFKNKKLNLRSLTCKYCQKIYKDVHYKNNKRSYYERNRERRKQLKLQFFKFKLTLKCEKCGEKHPACLDFHHKVQKEKSFNISRAVHECYSKSLLENELKKCRILCSNCHRKEHFIAPIDYVG